MDSTQVQGEDMPIAADGDEVPEPLDPPTESELLIYLEKHGGFDEHGS